MDWARRVNRRYIGKSVYRIQDTAGVNTQVSSEENGARSQEKLLVIMNKWPVPKPTQVVKARSLR